MDTDDDTPAFARTLGAMYGSSSEQSEDEEEEEVTRSVVTTKTVVAVSGKVGDSDTKVPVAVVSEKPQQIDSEPKEIVAQNFETEISEEAICVGSKEIQEEAVILETSESKIEDNVRVEEKCSERTEENFNNDILEKPASCTTVEKDETIDDEGDTTLERPSISSSVESSLVLQDEVETVNKVSDLVSEDITHANYESDDASASQEEIIKLPLDSIQSYDETSAHSASKGSDGDNQFKDCKPSCLDENLKADVAFSPDNIEEHLPSGKVVTPILDEDMPLDYDSVEVGETERVSEVKNCDSSKDIQGNSSESVPSGQDENSGHSSPATDHDLLIPSAFVKNDEITSPDTFESDSRIPSDHGKRGKIIPSDDVESDSLILSDVGNNDKIIPSDSAVNDSLTPSDFGKKYEVTGDVCDDVKGHLLTPSNHGKNDKITPSDAQSDLLTPSEFGKDDKSSRSDVESDLLTSSVSRKEDNITPTDHAESDLLTPSDCRKNNITPSDDAKSDLLTLSVRRNEEIIPSHDVKIDLSTSSGSGADENVTLSDIVESDLSAPSDVGKNEKIVPLNDVKIDLSRPSDFGKDDNSDSVDSNLSTPSDVGKNEKIVQLNDVNSDLSTPSDLGENDNAILSDDVESDLLIASDFEKNYNIKPNDEVENNYCSSSSPAEDIRKSPVQRGKEIDEAVHSNEKLEEDVPSLSPPKPQYEDITSAVHEEELLKDSLSPSSGQVDTSDPCSTKQEVEVVQSTQSPEISSQSPDLESIVSSVEDRVSETPASESLTKALAKCLEDAESTPKSTLQNDAVGEHFTKSSTESDDSSSNDNSIPEPTQESSSATEIEKKADKEKAQLVDEERRVVKQGKQKGEKVSKKSAPGSAVTGSIGGRRLRQIRHPSAKAAEAAADAAFVAAVTPTRKNLKEAKIACAIANVSDSTDMHVLSKKAVTQSSAPRSKKSRSSSFERTLSAPADSSGVYVDESSSSDKNLAITSASEDEKTSSKVALDDDSDVLEESMDPSQSKVATAGESGKPIGIKLKISKESVQILDPSLKKLEVQIPSDATVSEVTSATPSPGGSKRTRKFKDEPSLPSSLSPITLKIAKSKEGLEVVSGDGETQNAELEGAKVEKITLKISKDDSASIIKQGATWDENVESKIEKLRKEDSKIEDNEEAKLEKITLKLSKDDVACIIKKKDVEVASSAEPDSGKLERITLKRSSDNNVSIVRGKDSSTIENNPTVEKITLKVSKNDNVCIVKPTSPVPPVSSVEKLTLKVSKDGTAAVSGRSRDDSPSSRDPDCSKLEKITLKLSKDEGVSIVKPSSPTPERIAKKVPKDEPLSPLSPLTISRLDDSEPQKERITLKLSKAGGHPSPVGTLEERTSWSIKSLEMDPALSPSESISPKLKSKRCLPDTPEAPAAKKIKLTEVDGSDDCEEINEVEMAQFVEKKDDNIIETPPDLSSNLASKRPIDSSACPVVAKKMKVEEPVASELSTVWPSAGKTVEVVDLDTEDSQDEPIVISESKIEEVTLIDIEDEIPRSVVVKRKPRGRPRKTVLPPGAIPIGAIASHTEAPSTRKSVAKVKKEKPVVEPLESDRPKRSCKGREKPPPKPPKPVKPRGRNAVAAKQSAREEDTVEGPQLFEEETRMSADCGSRSETPAVTSSVQVTDGLQMTPKVLIPRLSTSSMSLHSTPSATPAQSPGPPPLNEESQGSMSMVSSTTTTESTPNKGNRKGRMEINVDPDAKVEYTVDMIAEYVWPITDSRNGETYMIQEQISEYLKVKSFKRKYPNMLRRAVDHDERQYLLEKKLVSESLCDMGLTAVSSQEVLDVMCTDFPEKYEEYRRYSRERAARELSNKQKALVVGSFSGKEDSKSKAMRNMATFNTVLNRSRRDHRRCCFDLQTFSVHYPEHRRLRMTHPNVPRVGAHPIALVPGQFTDYYKEYTAAELRYFPLNTVLYGPLLPHETMKLHVPGGSDGSQTDTSDSSSSDESSSDSGSSGSDSDSDSGSSSGSEDESSNQTGAGTAESQDCEVERPDAICRVCNGDRLKNRAGRAEPLVHCANCSKSGHPSCLDLTVDMVPHIKKYAWQCTDCKLCAQCHDTADEDKMLFCDMCDRGYHIYCVGLRKVPDGRWHCRECAMCASCGARSPGGTEEQQAAISQAAQDTPSKVDIPQWQHEFKKGDKGARVYVRTLCVPCSKLWRKGRYCRLCWKCYGNQPEEEGLINCSVCDRWMHADCCRKAGRVIDMEKLASFLCELCQQKGVRIPGMKSPLKTHRS